MSQTSLDEVFRFVLLRPPTQADDEGQIALTADSRLQNEIAEANGDLIRIRGIAQAYLGSNEFVSSVRQLENGPIITAMFRQLRGAKPENNGDIRRLVAAALEEAGGEINRDALDRDRMRLADSLIATKYAHGANSGDELAAALRVVQVLLRANEESLPDDGSGLIRLLSALPVGPLIKIRTNPPPPVPAPPPKPQIPEWEIALEELFSLGPESVKRPVPLPFDDIPSPQPDGVIRRALESIGLTQRTPGPVAVPEVDDREIPLSLTAAAAANLTAQTQIVLNELRLDPQRTPLPTLTNRVHDAILGKGQDRAKFRTGATFLKDGVVVHWDPPDPRPPQQPPPSIPATHGEIRPAGIADLLIVRQQIKRYEGGEVGDIENILKGELKDRTHRRLEQSETILMVETENTKEETREHETTERFEMQREVSKTIEDEASLNAGLTVSGSYGPSVEFSSSFDLSASTSATESTRTASEYAKQVTDRSLNRIVERVREQRTQRLLREVEEIHQHKLDNTAAQANIAGVYQWVDKIYEAQIFNYGKRLLFDIMVPEPAAFFIHGVTAGANRPDMPVPPDPLTITPALLTESNYEVEVAKYGATGVSAPPAPYVHIAKTFEERSGEGSDARLTKVGEVPVPDGYEATYATANWQVSKWDGFWFDVFIGDRHYNGGFTTLNNLRGNIGVGMNSGIVEAFTLVIQIYCRRTTEAVVQWRLKTYEAIRQAYLERVREFESKMSAIAAQAAIEIQGRNPAANRQIEAGELKKSAISLLTAQRFELFDAMHAGDGLIYPEFDFDEARLEGSYIRFFEQAFEWPQMTYLFYPYFWARKTTWIDKLMTEDIDPQFTDFLRAGSARVVIPVRPGFEQAVLHFQETGQIWNGTDDPPEVTSPLYVSLVQEMKERTGSFDNEVEVGDPWDVRVPTSLVKLRADDTLPEWQKQADGSWSPVN